LPFEFSQASVNENVRSDQTLPSVLIVEDDPGMRTLLERELSRAGFDAFLVSSACEARYAMEALVFPIAVIDRGLGDADGIDLIAELRTKYANHRVYIVLLSSLDSAEEQVRGINAGADAYVSKTQFPEAFMGVIAKGTEVARLSKR
jgi:DNA-binding response OmpR family regulator